MSIIPHHSWKRHSLWPKDDPPAWRTGKVSGDPEKNHGDEENADRSLLPAERSELLVLFFENSLQMFLRFDFVRILLDPRQDTAKERILRSLSIESENVSLSPIVEKLQPEPTDDEHHHTNGKSEEKEVGERDLKGVRSSLVVTME